MSAGNSTSGVTHAYQASYTNCKRDKAQLIPCRRMVELHRHMHDMGYVRVQAATLQAPASVAADVDTPQFLVRHVPKPGGDPLKLNCQEV